MVRDGKRLRPEDGLSTASDLDAHEPAIGVEVQHERVKCLDAFVFRQLLQRDAGLRDTRVRLS